MKKAQLNYNLENFEEWKAYKRAMASPKVFEMLNYLMKEGSNEVLEAIANDEQFDDNEKIYIQNGVVRMMIKLQECCDKYELEIGGL